MASSTQYQTFRQWLEAVDHALAREAGLFHDDLTDQPWMDWFQDEVPPEEAARMALAEDGFPSEDDESWDEDDEEWLDSLGYEDEPPF